MPKRSSLEQHFDARLFAITPALERELIDAGALDESGYILRRKVREAFDRICENNVKKFPAIVTNRNAELFLLLIWNQAKHRKESFDESAQRMGY